MARKIVTLEEAQDIIDTFMCGSVSIMPNTYSGLSSPVTLQCICGHKWNGTLIRKFVKNGSFIKQQQCPKCNNLSIGKLQDTVNIVAVSLKHRITSLGYLEGAELSEPKISVSEHNKITAVSVESNGKIVTVNLTSDRYTLDHSDEIYDPMNSRVSVFIDTNSTNRYQLIGICDILAITFVKSIKNLHSTINAFVELGGITKELSAQKDLGAIYE